MSEPVQKPGRSKQDYGTPRSFLSVVQQGFGRIDIDLAASLTNRVVDEFYPEYNNSLLSTWALNHPTGNLWLNPPFGSIGEWAEKCALESKLRAGFILMLTPASVGSNWFRNYVLGHAYVLSLSPRLTFVGARDPYPKDLMLSVYGYGLTGFDQWVWNK